METWLSGRKYLTANEASFYRDRGFESLRLRQMKNRTLRSGLCALGAFGVADGECGSVHDDLMVFVFFLNGLAVTGHD